MRSEIGDRGLGASESPRNHVGLRTSVWIRSRGFRLTQALRAFTERRLRRAIPGRLRSVMVRLDDVNGPRGGNDKRCQIVAQLVPRGDVRVQERNGDLYTAISRAVRRLERTVARIAERQQRARGFRDTFGREVAQ
jgi:putative sigma-54 modulation protein